MDASCQKVHKESKIESIQIRKPKTGNHVTETHGAARRMQVTLTYRYMLLTAFNLYSHLNILRKYAVQNILAASLTSNHGVPLDNRRAHHDSPLSGTPAKLFIPAVQGI